MRMWRWKIYIFNVDCVQGEMSGTFFLLLHLLVFLIFEPMVLFIMPSSSKTEEALKKTKNKQRLFNRNGKMSSEMKCWGMFSHDSCIRNPERKLKVTWGFELKSRLDPPNLCNLTYLSQNRVRITLNPFLIVWKQTDLCRTLWNEMNGSKLSWNNTNMKTTPSVHPVQTFF